LETVLATFFVFVWCGQSRGCHAAGAVNGDLSHAQHSLGRCSLSRRTPAGIPSESRQPDRSARWSASVDECPNRLIKVQAQRAYSHQSPELLLVGKSRIDLVETLFHQDIFTTGCFDLTPLVNAERKPNPIVYSGPHTLLSAGTFVSYMLFARRIKMGVEQQRGWLFESIRLLKSPAPN
jgi:hypothetical protein